MLHNLFAKPQYFFVWQFDKKYINSNICFRKLLFYLKHFLKKILFNNNFYSFFIHFLFIGVYSKIAIEKKLFLKSFKTEKLVENNIL